MSTEQGAPIAAPDSLAGLVEKFREHLLYSHASQVTKEPLSEVDRLNWRVLSFLEIALAAGVKL